MDSLQNVIVYIFYCTFSFCSQFSITITGNILFSSPLELEVESMS